MIIKRPNAVSKQILISLLVIALTSVIAALAGSVSEQERPSQAGPSDPLHIQEPKEVQASKDDSKSVIEPRSDSPLAPASESTKAEPKAPEAVQQSAQSAAASAVEEKPAEGASVESGSESSKRKGRAEQSTTSTPPAQVTVTETPKAAAEKTTDKSATSSKLEPKSALAKGSKPPALLAKSGGKNKLPANLGTVTSTGSGGPTHYMSKHDAYSAIAEKHGALAQDAMRKSDKRSQLHGFGGIQKASGLGDMFSPFKGVSDSGLARTLGASMRSIMKSKYSVPAYVASALLGAVALLAFYESPISPLPVPPLPEPPVGRFPPEMPNISPNAQVPFRTNQQQYGQQQGYNQRSFNPASSQPFGNLYQQQQVLFPSQNNAQQRQSQSAAGPVQQLAANLLSVGKQQIARKSGPDYDQQSISRSLFSSGAMSPTAKMSAPANQQKQNSFLGFFGLGGGSNSAANPSTAPTSGESQLMANAAATLSGSTSDSKNQASVAANGLSNSHLVNKVKSYFARVSPMSSSSSSSLTAAANSNPYDQYQRMSFVTALMKDTAFLPAFLSPTRKSTTSPSSSGQQSSAVNKAQAASNAISSNGNGPAARMQVEGIPALASNSQNFASKQKPSGSSYGLVRTADRIAHALFETFTSGIAQRSAPTSNSHPTDSDRKQSLSSDDQSNQAASLASSLISDLVSSYSANVANSIVDQNQQQSSSQQSEQQSKSSAQHQNQQSEASAQSATARSGSDGDEEHNVQQSVSSSIQNINNKQQLAPQQSQSNQESSASAPHFRKTRSVGLEYPIESNQELVMREQQPSKAAQINNVIDFVADSYTHNRLLFNFVMNQVGLSQAVPYVEQILASGGNDHN